MRRDYFLCVFLACVCASLFFVCFVPNYFTYGEIVVREFGLFERIMSALYAVTVLLIIPVYAAYRKKLWITIGLASYGLLALIPEWVLPGLRDKVSGDDAGIGPSVANFILKFIYGMVKAPFAALSDAIGDNKACSLSKWILPASVFFYVACQLYRFYRDAYVAEQLDPTSIMDSTAKENIREPNETKSPQPSEPEVLGTVISAPVQPAPAPSPVREEKPSEPAPAAQEAVAIPMPPPPPAPEQPKIEAAEDSPTILMPPPPAPETIPQIPNKAAVPDPAPAPGAVRTPKMIEKREEAGSVIEMPAPKAPEPETKGDEIPPKSPYDDNGAIRL